MSCFQQSQGRINKLHAEREWKNNDINCWWETDATGPCYHNRSLIEKVVPWAGERQKNLQEIVTRCPAHSTGVVVASKYLTVFLLFYLPALHQRLTGCVTISPQSWACHCLSLTLAPDAVLVNAANHCHHAKPVTFILPLFITRSIHPEDTWNSWIDCPKFDIKTEKKKNWLFFSFLPQKAATTWQRWFPWQVEDRRRNGSWSRNSEEVFPGKLEVIIWTLIYSCNIQNCSSLQRLLEDNRENI